MGDPIEAYLERLRAKLAARFDACSVDRLVEEVRSHLQESASELRGNGCPPDLAADLAIARFGPVEKGPLFSKLLEQIGAGDRAWGRVAWAIALAGTLGLSLQALFAPPEAELTGVEALPTLTVFSLLYLLATWRARSLVPIREIVCSVMLVVLGASLIDPKIAAEGEGAMPEARLRRGRAPLMASNSGFDQITAGAARTLLADLDDSDTYGPPWPPPEATSPPLERQTNPLEASLPTTAGFHDPHGPPVVTRWRGWVPDAGRLAAAWLILIGILHVCGGWVFGLGRLEREQGVRLHT